MRFRQRESTRQDDRTTIDRRSLLSDRGSSPPLQPATPSRRNHRSLARRRPGPPASPGPGRGSAQWDLHAHLSRHSSSSSRPTGSNSEAHPRAVSRCGCTRVEARMESTPACPDRLRSPAPPPRTSYPSLPRTAGPTGDRGRRPDGHARRRRPRRRHRRLNADRISVIGSSAGGQPRPA